MIVDDIDYRYASSHKWHKSSGYAQNGRGEYLHIEIMGKSGFDTDHINGDKLDNRRSNLRKCSRSENQANRKVQVNNTSGYKGVGYSRREKLWHARIQCGGKRYSLGLHESSEMAALAYNKKATKLFGKYARLNVIKESHG